MADDAGGGDSQGLKDINTTLQSLVRYSGLTIQALQTRFPGQFVAVPATATSAGTPNSVAYDATHFYVCIAPNTWVRATLATF
jgi:hypothetical protein